MFAGIDVGSATTKAVLLNKNGRILSFSINLTSHDFNQSGNEALKLALEKIGKSRNCVEYLVSTGYGRRSLSLYDKALPEIICHAKGTKFLVPEAKIIIDIGGQDSKVIELDEEGNVIRFEMNDKCAAGTGRFLEVLSSILEVDVKDVGLLAIKSKNPCNLSSVCTVFAESEVISYLSHGRTREDISAGLSKAIAKRVIAMGRGAQISYKGDTVFTGGVAKNIGVVRAIEQEIGKEVIVPKEPQITAALGAAIFAKDSNKTFSASSC